MLSANYLIVNHLVLLGVCFFYRIYYNSLTFPKDVSNQFQLGFFRSCFLEPQHQIVPSHAANAMERNHIAHGDLFLFGGIMKKSNAAKRYFRQVRILFPAIGRKERLFLSKLNSNMSEFIMEHPACSYDEIQKQFGPPEDIIHAYLETLDTNEFCQQIRRRHYLRNAMIILVIAVLVTLTIRSYSYYRGYKDAQDSYIHREIVEIN